MKYSTVVFFPVSFLAAAAALLWEAPPAAGAAIELGEIDRKPLTRAGAVAEPFLADSAAVPEAVPLDPAIQFLQVTVGPDGVQEGEPEGAAAGDQGRLIYSNTLGIQAINFPPNQPVSDDIASLAPDGCNLKSFKFKVLGKVSPTGAGGPYTVTYGLYLTCPLAVGTTNAARDAVIIPGTRGSLTFEDDGPRTIKHVIDPHLSVPIPTNLYLGIRFNRANCGTVVGAPAMLGFSGDIFDFPGFPCNAFLGGFPHYPQASFWLEIYAEESCPQSFPGYKAEKPSGSAVINAANIQMADDFKLQVENCQMVGYEVAVRGLGFYNFDLRQQCDGQIIAGTEKTFFVNLTTTPQLQIARFSFDPPVLLPDDDLFLGFRSNSNASGVVIAGIQPAIGTSADDLLQVDPEGCVQHLLPQGVQGAVNLTVSCAGTLPVGACCDMALTECSGGSQHGTRCPCNKTCSGGPENGYCCLTDNDCDSPGSCQPFCGPGGTCEAPCRETAQMNCHWPPSTCPSPYSYCTSPPWEPAWVENGTCAAPPFEPVCGVAACCRPDDTCENLTRNECDAIEPLDAGRLWQAGKYCGESEQFCPFSACIARQGTCSLVHEGVGCNDPHCCQPVCERDPWCCHVEWDRTCVELVDDYCSYPSPNDTCIFSGSGGPIELLQSTPFFGINLSATEASTDQGFCCNGTAPGAFGYGTVWFRFVATHESAQIDTCGSDLEGDTLVNVYTGYCTELQLIACGDDEGCHSTSYWQTSAPTHTRFCVNDLIVGATYYVMLASKSHHDKGSYQIELKAPCSVPTFSAQDCNHNEVLDGCDIAVRTSLDCDRNSIPDECAPVSPVPDCNADGIVDTCDPLRQWFAGEPPSTVFGDSVAVHDNLMAVGNPYYLGNVQIYELYDGRWFHTSELRSPESHSDYRFGASVGLSDGWMLVAATGGPDQSPYVFGGVHAYQLETRKWQPRDFPKILKESDLNETVSEVVMAGDLAAVSIDYCGNDTDCDLGVVVHMFRRTDSSWVHDGRIPANGSFKRRSFDMKLAQNALAVSSAGLLGTPEAEMSDHLFIYEQSSTTWEPTTILSMSGERLTDQSSMAFDGRLLVIPTDYRGGFWSEYPPSAYFFRKAGSTWSHGSLIDPGGDHSSSGRVAAILASGLIAVTARERRTGCIRARLYDLFSMSMLNETLESGYCDDHPRNITMASAPGMAILASSPGADGDYGTIPGSVRIFSLPQVDCDYSGVSDQCEISDGILDDCNSDNVPDQCQRRAGDYDFDSAISLRDFSALQNCLSGRKLVESCCKAFDFGEPQGIDARDVRAFAFAMTGP